MSDAITLLRYIFNKFVGLVFDDLTLVNSNQTIGWVLVVCIVFGILIRSLLAVPSASQTFKSGSWKMYEGDMHYFKKYRR